MFILCGHCKYFVTHYVQYRDRYIPTGWGQCAYMRRRAFRGTDSACERFLKENDDSTVYNFKNCGTIKQEVIGMTESLKEQAYAAATEIIETAGLKSGQILVVGCSTSEILGQKIGTYSSPDAAAAVFAGIYAAAQEKGIYVAAQCCEHLNRAIITERKAVSAADIVNVVPQPKAGGSFATAAYAAFAQPVALEEIRADAGLDIGYTMIGMHLKRVAVPVRLNHNKIGDAVVLAARVRPKFIGGERAHYDEKLK